MASKAVRNIIDTLLFCLRDMMLLGFKVDIEPTKLFSDDRMANLSDDLLQEEVGREILSYADQLAEKEEGRILQ